MNTPAPEEISRIGQDLTHAELAYYGYTPEQISAIEHPIDHIAAGCVLNGEFGIDHTNEFFESNHPEHDDADQVAGIILRVLESQQVSALLGDAERRGAEKALLAMAQHFENGHVVDEPHSFRAANFIRVRADDIARDAS